MENSTQPKFPIVMLIDDNNIDLYIASKAIIKNNIGGTVLQYSQADRALNYLEENSHNFSLLPNLILVDIYMPGMSGFEFMESYESLSVQLKEHCNVYIVSSSIDEDDLIKAKNDSNIIDFKVKPISKDFLENLCVAI